MHAIDGEDLPGPGAVIAGKYEIIRALGRGGMGVVLEARHIKLGQSVALKLLLPQVRSLSDVTARFEREGRAAARLRGPHVARVLDIDVLPDGAPFMVMELLRGKELDQEATARGPLPIREAVGYLLQACAGMAEAHRAGIIHRDIKPSNLFLCDQGGQRTVKVLDFGISKLAGDVHASMTTTATAFGTPLYMSPEQVRSAKDVDVRSDVWALGVVLYEILAGVPPFNGPSATAILAAIIADKPKPLTVHRPDVPQALSAAILKAIEKDPAQRYPDVQSFAAALAPFGPGRDEPALAAIGTELAAHANRPPTYAPASDALRTRANTTTLAARRDRFTVIAGAALGVLIAGAAALVLFATRPKPPVTLAPETSLTAQATSAPTVTPAPLAPSVEPPVDPVHASAAPAPLTVPAASARHKPAGSATATAAPSSAPKPPPDDPKYL